MTTWDEATRDLDAPLAVLDLDALEANAAELERRASGTPIRLASKSVRVREIVDRVLARPGWRGVMSYALAEALWLVEHGHDDVFVAYPDLGRAALARLAADETALQRITLAIDSVEHVAALADRVPGGAPLRVAVDVDASLRLGPVHLGVRRSPVRTPAQAAAVAGVAQRAGFAVVHGKSTRTAVLEEAGVREAAAVIVTLILIGRFLEARARGRASQAIQRLVGLQARTARVLRDGQTAEIALGEVAPGDTVEVRPGERVPVDGEVIDYCLARIPAQGETRGNLAAGGRGEARPLTESDWAIARRVGPTLKAKGLIFVGLDIIGDRLTEINVTSPTCVREIEAAFPISITGMLMDAIEKRLNK